MGAAGVFRMSRGGPPQGADYPRTPLVVAGAIREPQRRPPPSNQFVAGARSVFTAPRLSPQRLSELEDAGVLER